MYGTAAGTAWILFWMACGILDWGVGWVDFSTPFMWINGIGAFLLFGYFNGEEEKLKKAITNQQRGD